jgi:3',5'-cyclic-AMP phosphodiesterase
MLLAQISDLHIRPAGEKLYDFVDTNGLLARHVAYLNNLVERPDAVIVTGDITNCGRVDEYCMAKRILGQLDYPIYLLPGNHDNNGNFLAAFSPEHDYLGRDPERICFTVEIFPVRLVFLDSSVDGELFGEIGPKRLSWLEETLAKAPEKQTVVFMHHHPIPSGCRHMDAINCLDGVTLLNLLGRHSQVRHVFCGHTHRAIFQQLDGVLVGTAPATGHQVPFNTKDPNGLYNLEPPAMLMHRYSERTGLVSYIASLVNIDGPFRFDCTPACTGEPEV